MFYFYLGFNYYIRIFSIIDRELLKLSVFVVFYKYFNALVDVFFLEVDSSIVMLIVDEKFNVVYVDIGGMDI